MPARSGIPETEKFKNGGGDALPLPFIGKLTMQEMGSFTPIGAKTAVPFINFHRRNRKEDAQGIRPGREAHRIR